MSSCSIQHIPKKRRELTISKRGTILLSKALLIDQLGFKERDKLRIAKRRDSIILKKTERRKISDANR